MAINPSEYNTYYDIRLPKGSEMFYAAAKEFPRWFSIRKRPDKAIMGTFLKSIILEENNLRKELDHFIKEFYLRWYNNIDSTDDTLEYVAAPNNILDKVFCAQVGTVDLTGIKLVQPDLAVTTDGKFWLNNSDNYALYEDGYIIVSELNLPEWTTVTGSELRALDDFDFEYDNNRYIIKIRNGTPGVYVGNNIDSLVVSPFEYNLPGTQYNISVQVGGETTIKRRDNMLTYIYKDYRYKVLFSEFHIWNIFDEFAAFLGLERFQEETNDQLRLRCYRVFQYPTNSTRTGLKNTIINALYNDIVLDEDDILIEALNEYNAWLPQEEYGTVYEGFLQLNKDVLRTKRWNQNYWEHNFKKLDWLPHPWDKPIEASQNGVGQWGDLKVSLAREEGDKTDLSIYAFKQDEVLINDYLHKAQIRQKIPLQLFKYQDILNPKIVQYRITATPAYRIDPHKIYLLEQQYTSGVTRCYLEDIIVSLNGATPINAGTLNANTLYDVEFYSEGSFADTRIFKANLVEGDTVTSKLNASGSWTLDSDTGILSHVDVKKHIDSIDGLLAFDNMKDSVSDNKGGFTIDKNSMIGTFEVDLTGCGGLAVYIDHSGVQSDITQDLSVWTLSGLKIDNYGCLYSDDQSSATDSASFELQCMSFSFSLRTAENQGSMSVEVFINDKKDDTLSQILSVGGQTVSKSLTSLSKVKVVFSKYGEYPAVIENIRAARYKITPNLYRGEFTVTDNVHFLPSLSADTFQKLIVTVEAYDSYPPIIRSVHVGATTGLISYTISDVVSTRVGSWLDISSGQNFKVRLIKKDGGATEIVSDNLITKTAYINSTDRDIFLDIDTSRFSLIEYSSKKISKGVSDGVTVSRIKLEPGESISSLEISGKTLVDVSRRSLYEVLGGMQEHFEVYVAKGIPGFIVYNADPDLEAPIEWLTTIKKQSLSDANLFTYQNLPTKMYGFFVVSKDKVVKSIAPYTGRNIQETYISVVDDDEFVAYNQIKTYQEEYKNIDIVNTFSPVTSLNRLLVYRISDVDCTDNSIVSVNFMKRGNNGEEKEDNWSLNKSNHKLQISSQYDFNNSESYDVRSVSVENKWTISNEIKIDRYLVYNGTEYDLAEYVVTPPEDMFVNFNYAENVETFYAEEDGFNKLQYSNVSEILAITDNGATLSQDKYELRSAEGIIVWKNMKISSVHPHLIVVGYRYGYPLSLQYISLSSLYKIVHYAKDAYKLICDDPMRILNASDGDKIVPDWGDDIPDKVVVTCDNSGFYASYHNGTVSITRINNDDVLLVQAGYYYDNYKEYYYYNHDCTNVEEQNSDIIRHNVNRYGHIFQFFIPTSNYLLHTDFEPGTMYEQLCYALFSDEKIKTKGISNLNMATACDTYNLWYNFNMAVSFDTGIENNDDSFYISGASQSGLGTRFRPTDDISYSLLEITPYIRENSLISIFVKENIVVTLCREIKLLSDPARRSTFAELFQPLVADGDYRYIWFNSSWDYTLRYFLLVQGAGVIDDIIIRDDVPTSVQHSELHKKNIRDFRFSEGYRPNFLLRLQFDPVGSLMDQTEITEDNTVRPGANIDYGVSLLYSMSDHYDQFNCSETISKDKNKKVFYGGTMGGTITSPVFRIHDHYAIDMFFIKINNVLIQSMTGFNVTLYSKGSEDGISHLVKQQYLTNLLAINGNMIDQYIQFEIGLPAYTAIENIELIARYAEYSNVPLSVTDYNYGEFVTKIYDVGKKESRLINSTNPTENALNRGYRFHHIDGESKLVSKIKLYMRGYQEQETDNVWDENRGAWTNWYEIHLNDDLTTALEPHRFSMEDYHLFQFKLIFNSAKASLKVKNFVLEVI